MSLALLIVGLVALPSTAQGAEDRENGPDGCTVLSGSDSVEVGCEVPGSSWQDTVRTVGITGPPKPCVWTASTASDGWDPAGYGDDTMAASGYRFATTGDNGIVRLFPDGRSERVFGWVCPNGVSGFTWVDTSITVGDVIDDAVDRVRGAVPVPVLDVSPAPEVGGIVNLGLWLSVIAQDPVTVRAEAGLLWAEATVSLVSTRWEMGNGDVVECDGAGTAIVDSDTLEEGPCGYTYRVSSPGDDPYRLSVTATWAVRYRSSGGSGSRSPVERTLSVDYDVDEIQTVGISN